MLQMAFFFLFFFFFPLFLYLSDTVNLDWQARYPIKRVLLRKQARLTHQKPLSLLSQYVFFPFFFTMLHSSERADICR